MLSPDLAVLSFPLAVATLPGELTQAERDIAERVYMGESSDAIARARGTSEHTISNQLEALYRKLQVGSRAELIVRLRGSRRA